MPTTPPLPPLPLPEPEPEEWAIQLAAQAWCEPETSSVVMDERLAFVFARMLTREADRRSRAPDGFWLAPMEPDEAMQDDAREGDRKYAQRVFGDIMTVQQGPWDHWIAMRDSWLARQNLITAVTTPTEPAARAQAEPVAWIVYLPSMQTQEIFDSQEDAGYVDWLTNYPDAEVTPLYTASQSEAVQVRATWRPIGTAPMDGTPILALCQHTADAYYDGDRLTDYGARSEGLSHVEDGPHVIVWGESYDVSDGWENPSCTIPAGWELSHDCEVMANPIGWMPVPGTAPAIPQPAATAGKAEGEVVPWGTGLLAREELANDGHVGAGPIAAPAGADTRRLDWLDAQRVAYGFADVHEGNGWEISGAYGSIRQAIDHESGTTGEASHG